MFTVGHTGITAALKGQFLILPRLLVRIPEAGPCGGYRRESFAFVREIPPEEAVPGGGADRRYITVTAPAARTGISQLAHQLNRVTSYTLLLMTIHVDLKVFCSSTSDRRKYFTASGLVSSCFSIASRESWRVVTGRAAAGACSR
ncbi:hypothetical protein EYF80_021068 [Liparis tanakae]|uniref:Uncharacterized protein n=1 Tax=Liparis tanakae TaxID=230148 RepID=A0A4Z2HSD0_9TELE|nr:hypothetical protein EYF80_021068 [Liparis tanakae]